MDLTPLRGYPIPSSNREPGNGGLHSEYLGRAVAADLDVLDPAWAAEMQHATQILTMSTNQTGIPANTDTAVTFNTISKQTSGVGLGSNSVLAPVKGGDGWYHVHCSIRAAASGTITAGALHRLTLRTLAGDILYVSSPTESRPVETIQQGTLNIYLQVEAMIKLRYADNNQVWPIYVHTNTGSTMNVVAAGGSFLTATKIVAV